MDFTVLLGKRVFVCAKYCFEGTLASETTRGIMLTAPILVIRDAGDSITYRNFFQLPAPELWLPIDKIQLIYSVVQPAPQPS